MRGGSVRAVPGGRFQEGGSVREGSVMEVK